MLLKLGVGVVRRLPSVCSQAPPAVVREKDSVVLYSLSSLPGEIVRGVSLSAPVGSAFSTEEDYVRQPGRFLAQTFRFLNSEPT